MAIKTRKIGIIGAGNVGSHLALQFAVQGLADEVVFYDTNNDKAVGESLDLMDANSYQPHHFEAYAGTVDDMKDADILINSSAGTSEFSAAAIVASMMSPGVNSFTVGTREFTIKTEDIRSLYYRAGRPVGLTEHTNTPRIIPNFDIEMPPENLVLALREFHAREQEGKTLTARCVIQQLKDRRLWTYKPSPNEKKTEPKQKETMYYQRHYLEYWISHGWIEKPNGSSKYKLTENGLVVIRTFYV